MITTSIEVEKPLKQYLHSKFYDPDIGGVRFPHTSDIYHLLWDLIQRRPPGISPIDKGNLSIALPDRRLGKDPKVFNYLSARSVAILKGRFRAMMSAELHDWIDEAHHNRGLKYKDALHTFIVNFEIDPESEDALWKNYQRWRDKMRRTKKRSAKRFPDKNPK